MSDVLVLCYHAVSEGWPAEISVRPEVLRRQLETLLARGYRGATFHDAVTTSPNGRMLSVTFDDGFRSVLELAFPLLSELGLPATLFVPTDFAGRPGPAVWSGIEGWLGGPHEAELATLGWDELRDLVAAGWEIGSHTRSHPHLTQVDDERLADELRASRVRCEEELGRPCPSLAYPYGDVDERVAAAAAAAGYACAAALLERPPGDQRFAWPRIGVWRDDGDFAFRAKVSPAVRRVRAGRAGAAFNRGAGAVRRAVAVGRGTRCRDEPPRGVSRELVPVEEAVAREWDELADRADGVPWLRPGWVSAWWSAFGRGTLHVLAVRRAGRLAAVVPLMRRAGVLESAANWHTPAFGALAEDAEALADLWGALFTASQRRVSLAFVDSERIDVGYLCGVAAVSGYRVLERTLERAPFVRIDTDWGTYEAGRDPKVLKELRRRKRRLEELGKLELRVEDGSGRLQDLLEEGFRVEASGWKGERGTSVSSDPATRRFYGDVARWAVERGWLRLAFLRLDGRAIAFQYCVEAGGVHYLLKPGYDPAYRRFGTGKLMCAEMLERAFALGLDRYEFGGHDEPWKLEWATGTHDLVLVQAFARSVPGLIDWAAWVYGRPLAKRVLAVAGR